jgi:uncharacterized protein YlxW (UPF0749 family)
MVRLNLIYLFPDWRKILFISFSGLKRHAKVLNALTDRFKGKSRDLSVSSLKSTVEKIKALETERKNLLLELEQLKKMAESKANALESEINMLRDEVKSLRILLTGEEPEAGLGQKKKK